MNKHKRNKLILDNLIFQRLSRNVWGFQFPANNNCIIIRKYDEDIWQAEYHIGNIIIYSDVVKKKDMCLSSLEAKLNNK